MLISNDSTIWMTQKVFLQLYQTSPQNVTLHIKKHSTLMENYILKQLVRITKFNLKGARTVQKSKIYNLDMILAIGYRVRCRNIGIHFRNWSPSVSRIYEKGFVLNDERLKKSKNLVPTTSMNFLNVSEIFVLLKTCLFKGS